MLVTRANFYDFVKKLANGLRRADYNNECFSLKEVLRYIAVTKTFDYFVDELINCGYNPCILINPVAKNFGCEIEYREHFADLKARLDDGLSIVIEDEKVLNFLDSVYNT